MRLLRLATWFGLVALGILHLPSASHATPIGPSCGTCQGSIYELTYSGSPIATTATTETFEITYTIDTSGYNGGGVKLDIVAMKVSSSFVDATLVTAPGGVAKWREITGGLNANGCSGSGSGFDCVAIKVLGDAPSVPNGIYTWVFDIEVATGGLFTGDHQSSVKARYVNSSGVKVGALVSEGITLESVPEPSTGLLALALPGLAVFRTRRPR